jgi:ABC-type uncharacterized transport system involved in gliding motility auxiliary subunit
MSTPLAKKLTSAAGLALVAGSVIAVNVIASRLHGLRADLTEEKLYSLSQGTRDLVRELERDITLKFFWTQGNEDVPPMIQQYGQRVFDLLKEYEGAAGGRIALEIFDPGPDTDEEELARKYGLTPRQTNPFGGAEFYCGLVAVSGKQEKNLPFLSPEEDNQLEYKLTRLLTEVTTPNKPKLGVISSLPVMGSPPMNPFMGRRQPTAQKWIFVQQLESQFAVSDLGATAESIPDDIRTLVLVQPKGLSEKTQYAIDQFVLRGGRVLAFLDPSCLADQGAGPMPGMGGGPEFTRFLGAWGVELNTEEIAADRSLATKLSTQRRVADFPTVLSLLPGNVDPSDIATANLENLLLPTPGYFKSGTPAIGLTRIDLLKTSDQGAALPTFMAMGDDPEAMTKNMKPAGVMSLALRLTGKFPSAFPDGPPKPEGEAPAAPATTHLKEATSESVVVLVADADLLENRWSVDAQNFMGMMMIQPLNDNLNLVLNLAEQLSGSNALISLRSRGAYARPFTTIAKMEEKARARYQSEIDAFQAQLEEARRKLQELQAGKAQDQRLILSPEAQAEIAKLRQQELEASRRTREIRKELRREIEGTEKFIQFANIIGVPVAVGLVGLTLGLRRRARATTSA